MSEPTPRECLLARVLSERTNAGPIILLSARNTPSAGEENFAREAVAYRLGRSRYQPMLANTQEELAFVLPMLTTDVTLVTSAYHQLRAFLTFVRVLPRPWTVRIWNAPAPSPMTQLADEFAKIERYQEQGDVAPYVEALAYLDWRDAR